MCAAFGSGLAGWGMSAGLAGVACLLAADVGAAVIGSWTAFFLGHAVGLASLILAGLGASDVWWVVHLHGPAPALVSAVLAYRVFNFLPWAIGSLAMTPEAAGFGRN